MKMKNMNISMMNAETLESTRIELAAKIESLPQRFCLNGVDFIWQENVSYQPYTENEKLKFAQEANLRIIPLKKMQHEISFEIGSDGLVKYYSFFSSSGKNNADAEKTLNYYSIYCTLLSENFREQILRDYREKLETLNVLKAEYEAISEEQGRRRETAENEKKALEEKETAERHAWLEAVGQVWFDYNRSNYTRYTVKSVTEKNITFSIWCFSEKDNCWIPDPAGYTKRISRHLLGQKPLHLYNHQSGKETEVCPVGTDDLQSQKPGQPETVNY
jgi:hypothetical protein